MSKAEELAEKAYPYPVWSNETTRAIDDLRRNAFIEGYHQAERDLELTIEDIKIILDAEYNILHECNDNSQLVVEAYSKGEDYYGEILKRFKAQKGE